MSRLRLVFGTVSYEGDVIQSCSLTQEVNALSEELSIDTFECTLYMENAATISQHERVQVIFGTRVLGTYYRTDFKQVDENLYSLKFHSILGVIDKKKYAGAMLSGLSAAQAIEDITGTDVSAPWHVFLDSAFASHTVSGYIPPCTWREALQQIAFSIGACVSPAHGNGILFFPPETQENVITKAEVFDTLDITDYQPVTSIRVAYHSYVETEETSGEDIFEFGDKHYLHTVGYQTVVNDGAADADEYVLAVEDATLVHSGNVSAVLDRLAAYYFGRVTWRNKIVAGTRMAGNFARVPAFSDTTITGGISRMQYRDVGYKLFADMELDGHYANVCALTVIYTDSNGNVLKTVMRNFAAGSTYSIQTSALEWEADATRTVYLPSVAVLTGTITADKTETVMCMTAAVKEGDMLTVYAVDGAAEAENTLIIE